MSYHGGIDFGLLGDYDALPDLDRLGDFVRESLAELVSAAELRGDEVKARVGTATPA